jgi:hypothetical protein
MADDGDATTAAVTFRLKHLVRLRGFNHAALDDKLVRIQTDFASHARGKFGVDLPRRERGDIGGDTVRVFGTGGQQAILYICGARARTRTRA